MGLPLSFVHPGMHLIPFRLTAPSEGGWSWFGDPRAVHASGITFFCYESGGAGNISVASYDHTTGLVSTPFVLRSMTGLTGPNDHGVPALFIRPSDSRLLALYHNDDNETAILMRVSTNPLDATVWGSETDITSQVGAGVHYFHNMLYLSGTTTLYLFYQGYFSGQPRLMGFSTSTDGGTTWSTNTSVYVTSLTWSYFKVCASGTDRIDFCVTDNHPDVGATSIYHGYYQSGSYYKSDGTLISATLPFDQTALTNVYDGSAVSGWIWDITVDPATGHPIIVFATFPSTSDHRYQYAAWTGSAWSTHEICTAGGFLYAGEPHYSGGVVLDHSDPSIVHASRNLGTQWEMWRFVTTDGGATWAGVALTANSAAPQIRPVGVRDRISDLAVIWLSGSYTTYQSYVQGIQAASG